MKRAGFTMIELIFVIVILGILAAVAIPKLAATRNDAKIASELTSVSQALQNLGAEYVATGDITAAHLTEAQNSVKCFTFTQNGATTDGNITLAIIGAASTDCPAAVLGTATTGVEGRAVDNGLLSAGGASKDYSFGGTGVVQ